eukprot:13828407-Alexandrium_andersonii.AAC.1
MGFPAHGSKLVVSCSDSHTLPYFPPSLAPPPVRTKPKQSAVAQDITICPFTAQSLRDKGVQSKSGVSLRM